MAAAYYLRRGISADSVLRITRSILSAHLSIRTCLLRPSFSTTLVFFFMPSLVPSSLHFFYTLSLSLSLSRHRSFRFRFFLHLQEGPLFSLVFLLVFLPNVFRAGPLEPSLEKAVFREKVVYPEARLVPMVVLNSNQLKSTQLHIA